VHNKIVSGRRAALLTHPTLRRGRPLQDSLRRGGGAGAEDASPLHPTLAAPFLSQSPRWRGPVALSLTPVLAIRSASAGGLCAKTAKRLSPLTASGPMTALAAPPRWR